jgi:NNP family nitrate/nitrite transporter-like MFS transporter
MGHLNAFLKSGDRPTLAASFLYFDVSFMVWTLLGALGNFIAADFGLSGTEKGLMTATPILAGSFFRLILGPMGDRFGGRRVGIAGLALTMVPLLIGWWFADSFSTVMLTGLLLGVAGASFAVALPLASRWYPPEHQGLAMGIAGAGNSGTVLASLFAPRLAREFGWEAVFGLALIPILCTLVAFILLAKDSPRTPRTFGLKQYGRVLGQADTGWFAAMYAVTFGGFVGLGGYLAIFLREQYDLSRVQAGDLTALCVFAASFARPVGGYLSDRFGGIRLLMVLLSLIALLMFGVAGLPPLGMMILLLVAVMAVFGMGNGAVFQLVPLRFPNDIGTVTGLVGAAGGVGGFLLPFLLGSLYDRTGSYATGFLVFTAGALVTLGVLVFVQQAWRSTWAPTGSAARTGRGHTESTVEGTSLVTQAGD